MDLGSGGGVWLGTRNRLALVARTGDIAPGTGGATFQGLVLGKIDINDDRQIASAARTSAGDVGLWISSERRELKLVALQGSEFEIAPDDKRTIARFQGQPGPDGVSDFFDFGNRGLLFALDFTDGTSGIFTARLSHHRTAEIQ